MSVTRPAPIYTKIRGSVPLTALLPRGELKRMRERLESDEKPGEYSMSEPAKEFLAHYMLVARAGWALLSTPPFASLARQHERLEDEFMSGGPPTSPIYDSYSSFHTLVEIPVGIGSETPMTVLARLTASNIEHRNVHLLATEVAASNLDLYRAQQVQGMDAQIVHVRSGSEIAVHLTGPFLVAGVLFLGRVCRLHTGAHFLADSPYLLLTSEAEWLAYFARIAGPEPNTTHQQKKEFGKKSAPKSDGEARLVRHLRQGEDYRYWPTFIMNAYAGERNGIVGLAGIPDRPETQPHHEDFDESTFEPDDLAFADEISPLERLRRRLYATAESRGLTQRLVELMRSGIEDGFVLPTASPYLPLFRALCCFGVPTELGATLLEEHAASGLAAADEMPVIRALQRGWFSMFEVRRVHLDRSLEVTDLLCRKRLEITERSATRGVGVSDVLAGWIMIDDDGTCRLEGGLLHLKQLLASRVLEDVRAIRARLRGVDRDVSVVDRLAALVPDVILATQRWTATLAGPPDDELPRGSRAQASSEDDALPVPSEIEAALTAQLLMQLRRTLDEPIPMFKGKTLRQLARNPKSRPDAISWLREQERILRASSRPIAVDLVPLWEELGLEYQGLGTDPVE